MTKIIFSFLTLALAFLPTLPALAQPTAASPTEGVITHQFVGEAQMQADLMAMLARFSEYMKAQYEPIAIASSKAKEPLGTFRSKNTYRANEDGVRTNADLSMVCAFLYKYGKGKVQLPKDNTWKDIPQDITWDEIKTMALQSLRYAIATHKAVRQTACEGGKYWGSTSKNDHQWESSLWAMSVAYSAVFQWDHLSKKDKQNIYKLLKAECQYELERDIPTGYKGDTKAEENGWEACVLAATLGMYPHDKLAPQWFDRLRRFAINSYSHESDAKDETIIDPHYDKARVMDLYEGANLYPDYTLQNHNYFHTSYQNVVIQELGEAALALKLFQKTLHGKETWKTRALMHHCGDVQREVLNQLALSDGELAMPNGNDWSLFLYDQLTSYTTLACFEQDADALMLENMAYKHIKARQQTTGDGSWLLRSDIGARRMGVEAHRVMMTWLMHNELSTSHLSPTLWPDFRSRHAEASVLESQGIVRAFTKDRFTTFGWQPGINSYTGYIASNTPDRNKIIVPYKANGTGNFLGWFEVKGHKTNAVPAMAPRFKTHGTAWTIDGALLTNDSTLRHNFTIYSTPGNAVIYLDHVEVLKPCTIMRKQGGLMAISTDEFTRKERTLYYHPEPYGEDDEDYDYDMPTNTIKSVTTSGDSLLKLNTIWINIDNQLGILAPSNNQIAFGDRSNNNSIMTSKLYAHYDDGEWNNRELEPGELVNQRELVFFTGVTAEETMRLCQKLRPLYAEHHGWNSIMVDDPDGTEYYLVSHLTGEKNQLKVSLRGKYGAPVFAQETTIKNSVAFVNFDLQPNDSYAQRFDHYIEGENVVAHSKDGSLWVKALENTEITVYTADGASETLTLSKGQEWTSGEQQAK